MARVACGQNPGVASVRSPQTLQSISGPTEAVIGISPRVEFGEAQSNEGLCLARAIPEALSYMRLMQGLDSS